MRALMRLVHESRCQIHESHRRAEVSEVIFLHALTSPRKVRPVRDSGHCPADIPGQPVSYRARARFLS
jgi:hypothetical protein